VEFVSRNIVAVSVDVYRKTGASNNDIEQIQLHAAQGLTPEQISPLVNVQIAVVERFMPKPAPAAPVAREKTLEEELEEAAAASAEARKVKSGAELKHGKHIKSGSRLARS